VLTYSTGGAGFAEYAIKLSIAEKSLIICTLKTLKMKCDKCVPYKKKKLARTRTHAQIHTVKSSIKSLLS